MSDAHAFVGIGSNLGDRAEHVQAAVEALGALTATRLVAVSTVIETEPVGPVEQATFLNAVAEIATGLPPRELLDALHAVERAHGRDRTSEQRWGPRTLDLDILLYAGLVIDEPGLTIPHPRLAERRFVLAPLAELAPELTVPGTGRTVAWLLGAVDQGGSA